MKRILLGVDDPVEARELVEWSARLATELHAGVTVVHAVHRSEMWFVAGVQLDCVRYMRAARDRVDTDVVAPLRNLGVPADLRVEPGDPAHRLAEIAHKTGAEMIVIGAGHSALHDLIAGGVEHRLARLVDIPLVVVPTRDATARAER